MSAIVSNPAILGGTPCFRGTRVPLQNLMDYLEGGDSLEVFLEQFPSVSRQQATAVLQEMSNALVSKVEVEHAV